MMHGHAWCEPSERRRDGGVPQRAHALGTLERTGSLSDRKKGTP